MSTDTQSKRIVTHSGGFHADDIFAVATLQLVLDAKKIQYTLSRTRDPKEISEADFVIDVGREHNPAANRFDHHQQGGAGERENGIPYAAFGLVWKTYGIELCSSQEAAERVDRILIQPIDAGDNGVDISTQIHPDVIPYRISELCSAFKPTWREDVSQLGTAFERLVRLAKEVITREVMRAQDTIEGYRAVRKMYENTSDSRILVLDEAYPYTDVVVEHPETLYVVLPERDGENWRAYAVQEGGISFKNRKDFPESWAGLSGTALQKETGVSDAVFCHNGRFIAIANSKEGAISLAELAVEK